MTFTEVTALLQQYEELARQQGAAAMELLRPGLTSDELDAVEARYGFTLPEDVRAVWSWHNGVGRRPSPDSPRRIGAIWDFMDLDHSIEHARASLNVRNAGDADRYLSSRWVTLAASSVSAVIETNNSRVPDAAVLVDDPAESVFAYPIVTVAQQLRWYIWAIESGAWYVDERGEWRSDFGKYPANAIKDII